MATRRMPSRQIRWGDGYITFRENKDGSISAQARWPEKQPNGKTAWKSKTQRADSREEAQQLAEDVLRLVGRARRANKYTPASRITVGETVEKYLQRGMRRWSSNTYASYKQVAKTRLIPDLGRIILADLTPLMVQEWLDQLTEREYKPSSVRNSRIVLMGACKEALRLGLIDANPVAGTQMPPRIKRSPTIWTAEHVEAVMKAVEDDAIMTGIYSVALTTGMRPGELRNLKWRHIDFEDQTIFIEISATRDEYFKPIEGKTTKTKRSRFIPLTDVAADALETARKDQIKRRLKANRWADTDIVFDRGDGNMLASESLHWKHRIAIAAASVPRIRMHDLRHTAATLMLKQGVPLEVVSRMLGHSSIAVTADVYGHVDISMQRPTAEALASLVRRKGLKFTHSRTCVNLCVNIHAELRRVSGDRTR